MAEGVQNDLCPGRIRKQQRRPRGVQPWRIAACRGCHAVQEIGGVSKPWLLSLFQDFGGPEVSLKFGSLDFSWISLPIVHVESINDELIWSADFGSMQLILVFLASSLQGPSLDPTPSIFYCRDSSFFEPNHFTSTASVWRKETHPLLAMPLFAPRQSQIPHLPQFWRVNKQTKGTPLQKQSERGSLRKAKKKRGACIAGPENPTYELTLNHSKRIHLEQQLVFTLFERKLVSTRINGLRRHNELLAAGVDDILFEHEWDLAARARVSEISI